MAFQPLQPRMLRPVSKCQKRRDCPARLRALLRKRHALALREWRREPASLLEKVLLLLPGVWILPCPAEKGGCGFLGGGDAGRGTLPSVTIGL